VEVKAAQRQAHYPAQEHVTRELLSRFSAWRHHTRHAIQWLWNQRTSESLWDFGPRASTLSVLPLSETWQKASACRFDWTTRVLILLEKYYNVQDGG